MNPHDSPLSRSRFPDSAQEAIRLVFGGRPFHTDGDLLALAFGSPSLLWSVEEPSVLRCWDVITGQPVAWRDLDDLGTSWTFSRGARLLAAGSDDLAVWDVPTGRRVCLIPQPSWLTAIAFHGDRLVATGHDDGTVRVWDLATQDQVAEFDAHRLPVSAVAFSADGKRLASAGEAKSITLWDLDSKGPIGQLVGHKDRIPALAWHPDGTRIYSAGWDTTVRVWNTTTLEPIILLNSHATQVLTLALSDDGKLLACADSANALHVWLTDANRPLCVVKEHEAEVRALAFSPDGQRLASGGADRVIRLWTGILDQASPPTGAVKTEQRAGAAIESARSTIALAPGNNRLACPSGGSAVRVWDTSSAQLVQQLQREESCEVQAVAWSGNGRWIAASGPGCKLALWDMEGGGASRTLEGHPGTVINLAFSPDSTLLASAALHRGDVWLWDVQTGEPALLIPDAVDACGIEALAFHPQKRWLAAGGVDWLSTGGSDGAVLIWDVDARAEVRVLDGSATALAFHPSGERLATASLSLLIRIWQVEEGRVLAEAFGHEETVTAVAFSPDGTLLASASDDRTLRLWDAANGAPLGGIELDTQIKSLAFSPDGAILYTGNANTSCYQLEVKRLLMKA